MTQEWISVKERLPNIKDRVLFYGANYADEPCIGFIDRDNHWHDIEFEKEEIVSEITHWQPLPDNPK